MRLHSLSKNWELATKNNTGLLIANVSLALLCCILSIMAFRNRERVILIPPHLDSRIELSMSQANKEYFEGWGLYVAASIGNLTPKSVQFTTDTLSNIFDPQVYMPIRTKMMSLLNSPDFMRSNAYSYFAPDQVVFEAIEKSTNRVFVLGHLNSSATNIFTDGKEFKDSKPVVYQMDFIMKDGRPYITAFNSYPGAQAKTQEYLKKFPEKEVKGKTPNVMPDVELDNIPEVDAPHDNQAEPASTAVTASGAAAANLN